MEKMGNEAPRLPVDFAGFRGTHPSTGRATTALADRAFVLRLPQVAWVLLLFVRQLVIGDLAGHVGVSYWELVVVDNSANDAPISSGDAKPR